MIKSLIMYCSSNVTNDQIDNYKLNICDDWADLEIEIKRVPVNKKPLVYADNISMKKRGLNLINKK